MANEASRDRAIQTAPVVLEDLVFTRRILREMQEQRIAYQDRQPRTTEHLAAETHL